MTGVLISLSTQAISLIGAPVESSSPWPSSVSV
jgi:hypothetical protein